MNLVVVDRAAGWVVGRAVPHWVVAKDRGLADGVQ